MVVAGRNVGGDVWRAILGVLVLIAGLFVGAWQLDEHYVTRREFGELTTELHAIHDELSELRRELVATRPQVLRP